MEVNKIKTPLWDLSSCADKVYEPSEDSFLLLDALEEELKFIRSLNPVNILEIGPGSGIIISALAGLIKTSNCIAIDINPFACKTTQKTALLNKVNVNVVQSDLVSGLKLNNQIDILVFNPPYVPSTEEEDKEIIDKAWAGNTKGRSTTDRLFPLLQDLMSDNCVGYLVALEENDPREMCEILNRFGFDAAVIKKRKIIGERLSILRFIRKTHLIAQ